MRGGEWIVLLLERGGERISFRWRGKGDAGGGSM